MDFARSFGVQAKREKEVMALEGVVPSGLRYGSDLVARLSMPWSISEILKLHSEGKGRLEQPVWSTRGATVTLKLTFLALISAPACIY